MVDAIGHGVRLTRINATAEQNYFQFLNGLLSIEMNNNNNKKLLQTAFLGAILIYFPLSQSGALKHSHTHAWDADWPVTRISWPKTRTIGIRRKKKVRRNFGTNKKYNRLLVGVILKYVYYYYYLNIANFTRPLSLTLAPALSR